MKKSDVNAALRKLGMIRVSMRAGEYGPQQKAIRINDKLVNGIFASTHGPMTVTNVYREKADMRLREIETALYAEGLRKVDGRFVVSENSRSVTYLNISEQTFPTYAPNVQLDPLYKSIWFVPTYTTEAKQ